MTRADQSLDRDAGDRDAYASDEWIGKRRKRSGGQTQQRRRFSALNPVDEARIEGKRAVDLDHGKAQGDGERQHGRHRDRLSPVREQPAIEWGRLRVRAHAQTLANRLAERAELLLPLEERHRRRS